MFTVFYHEPCHIATLTYARADAVPLRIGSAQLQTSWCWVQIAEIHGPGCCNLLQIGWTCWNIESPQLIFMLDFISLPISSVSYSNTVGISAKSVKSLVWMVKPWCCNGKTAQVYPCLILGIHLKPLFLIDVVTIHTGDPADQPGGVGPVLPRRGRAALCRDARLPWHGSWR